MNNFHLNRIQLDPLLKCEDTEIFYNKLKSKVIGQDEALEKAANVIQTYKAGLNQSNKPLAVVLYLGSSGVGKTLTIESVAECLFGNKKAFFKIDCGEFQGSSSISTLIGSPPGYLGFNSEAYISQAKLDKYQTKEYPINILLLDEIEKASESILQLLLGILDKGTLKTNQGEQIDFSKTIVFMTSNLGGEGISNSDKINMGFDANKSKKEIAYVKKTALVAAEKFFKPEFFNRIDHVVVCNSLTEKSIHKIFELEVLKVKQRIFKSKANIKFTFICTKKVEDFLIAKGYDKRYGARELKRVITECITNPISSIMMSNQIEFGDLLVVSLNKNNTINYEKIDNIDLFKLSDVEWTEFKDNLLNLEEFVSKPEELTMEHHHDLLVRRSSEGM